jgi:hypothetical protein
LWLQYVLKHRDYFDNPEKLATSIVQDNQKQYMHTPGINLFNSMRKAFALGQTAQEFIYGFWQLELGNRFRETDDLIKKGFQKFKDSAHEVIGIRRQQDGRVLERFNKYRNGEDTAVFWGTSHIHNQYGGFTQDPGAIPHSVFMLVYEQNLSVLQSLLFDGHFKSSDNLILALQSTVMKYGNMPRMTQGALRQQPAWSRLRL